MPAAVPASGEAAAPTESARAAVMEPDTPSLSPFLPGLLPETAAQPRRAPTADLFSARERTPAQQIRRAIAAGYQHIDFLVALVPDPIDSAFAEDFDAYLAAIRLGLEAGDYVSDLFFDPWSLDEKDEGSRHRAAPGVMLFRRSAGAQEREGAGQDLFAVLLVGESPTWGVQKVALARALDTVDAFCGMGVAGTDSVAETFCRFSPDHRPPTVRLLGPTTSGATASLRAALADWLTKALVAGPIPHTPGRLEIISGSATAKTNQTSLEKTLPEEVARATGWSIPVSFRGAVNDDDALWTFVNEYLIHHLGARPQEIALLAESNTTYGREFSDGSLRGDKGPGAIPPGHRPEGRSPVTLAFPLHVSQAREQREGARSQEEPHRSSLPGRLLGLAGRTARQRTDSIPMHSALTANTTDVALTDLLRTIASEQIRFVGILATDNLDAIFLAEQVHDQFPQVQIVLFTSSLLYLHDDLAFLNGALVASTYPLGGWTKRMAFPFAGDELRLLFGSEYAQGTYNATLLLTEALRPDDVEEPRDYLDYGAPFVNPLEAGGDPTFAPPLWMSVIAH